MLRLKLLRLNAGLSQWALARKIEISQGRYSMIERALVAPTVEEREKLAAALAAPSSALFRPAVKTSYTARVRVGRGRTMSDGERPTGELKSVILLLTAAAEAISGIGARVAALEHLVGVALIHAVDRGLLDRDGFCAAAAEWQAAVVVEDALSGWRPTADALQAAVTELRTMLDRRGAPRGTIPASSTPTEAA